MNTQIVTIVSSILLGFFIYLRGKDYQKFSKNTEASSEDQKHIIEYIYRLELKIIIMWFFIMINIRVIIGGLN